MQDLIESAAYVQRELDARRLPNCLIGGIALQAWGGVRMTRDADFSVFTGFEAEDEKIRAMLQIVAPRVPDAEEFAIQNRVLLGVSPGGVPIDIGLAGFDYERRVLDRAVLFSFSESIMLRICSAEDLVVMKVFAGRIQDWADLESIIHRQSRLDWKRIEVEATPLLEVIDALDRWPRLELMRAM